MKLNIGKKLKKKLINYKIYFDKIILFIVAFYMWRFLILSITNL